jgi:hypothetical protein
MLAHVDANVLNDYFDFVRGVASDEVAAPVEVN